MRTDAPDKLQKREKVTSMHNFDRTSKKAFFEIEKNVSPRMSTSLQTLSSETPSYQVTLQHNMFLFVEGKRDNGKFSCFMSLKLQVCLL